MTQLYGSSMMLLIEANKENIPPGMEIKEPIVLPETRASRYNNEDNSSQEASPVPRPSPAMSQLSDASFLSCQDSPAAVNNNTSADEADDDMEITSRKEKSLGLLCQRFLIAMNEETRNSESKEVHLETVARKMNVEKRRIYDIVNVMEALDAMQKTNKSYYQWQGLECLPKLMSDLQAEAIEEGLPERVLRVEQAMCSFTELSGRNGSKDTVGTLISSPADPSTSSGLRTEASGFPKSDPKSRVDNRDRQGRNSLAQLCRRFLMVLLSNPKNVRKVSLDVASTVLIKDPETEGFEPPSRSRCRRLYDIANVLVALGLIKKVHYLFGTKKIPLFVYCGPEPDESAQFDVYASVERLLSSQQNTPSTPTIKAQTEKIVQQIAGFGKRAFSDNSLNVTANVAKNKMPKIKVEKVELPPPKVAPIPTPYDLQSFANQPRMMMFADLAVAERYRLDAIAHFSASMPSLYQSASTSTAENAAIPKPEPFKMNLSYGATFGANTNSYIQRQELKPIVPPQQSTELPVKHSMSNILGTSNKINIGTFDHTTSSPFQVVKKGETRQKKVFGEIQNFR